VTDEPISFPVLDDKHLDQWQWPMPPFDWRHTPAPGCDVVQPCVLETPSGTTVEGDMLGIDPKAGSLSFRGGAGGMTLSLPFARFRRLTLTLPLRPAPSRAGAPLERVPAAAQERDYTLHAGDGARALAGRTAGYVDAPEGLYLFAPVEEECLQRVFVPRWAYTRCEVGASAEEIAAERWIADPQQLLQAIERQQRTPVLPIGQALLNLGLMTAQQLERALAGKPADKPLGEHLVASGLLSRADLHTALAHKMGFPLVDLTRFPVDLAALRKLPLRTALECRALPLMIDGQRLIVAVDRPSREAKLRTAHVFAQMTLVPVLACKSHIKLALASLADQDAWSNSVAQRPGFFATTT